ncbi:MAG: B12-binding domain-containing radical SAM protein [Deltaproteobacteria bacterium]|nr:B12-binding domain-containing radical SAM protein [Deltaproteobacteria bacterium]
MRVMLIRPPAKHTVESEVPEAVSAENLSYPPLALMAIAQVLRDFSQHEVTILDAQLDDLDYDVMEAKIREWKPDVVGVTAFTVQLVDVLKTVQTAKKAGAKYAVVGGPHVSDFPRECVGLPGVDAVVKGEGQKPMLDLCDAWARGDTAKGIAGTMAHPDDPVPEQDVYFSNNLDDYPVIDRTLVDYKRYYDVMGKGGIFTTLISSRGCPYRCTFCNTPRHRYRVSSPGRVCDEIKACLDLGIEEFYFVDDTFNITNQRVIDLCDEILERGLKLRWTVRFRVKGVTRELLEKMKAAGCQRIQFGVEQGTEEGLLRLKKDVTVREIESAFRLCREVGINTVAYFMIGTPVERSRDDVMDTIAYSIKLDPDFVMFNVLTPFPGTTLYDEGLRDGVLDLDPWTQFMKNPREDFKAQVWDEHFSRAELREMLDIAYKKFYWRPKFVARNITQIQSPRDFMRKASAGLRMLVA